jgi:hypothetical protein
MVSWLDSSTSTSSMRMVVTGSMAIENSSRHRSLGVVRQGACEREALLLAAGEFGAEVVEPVLHLVPQRGLAEASLHMRGEFSARVRVPATRGASATLSKTESGRPTGSGATMPTLPAQRVDVAHLRQILPQQLHAAAPSRPAA